MRITKSIEIDAGHRVPLHGGKCRSPHGHRYRIEVEVDGAPGEDGMVLDYGVLKDALLALVDGPMDHAFIVQADDEPLRSFLAGEGHKVFVMDAAPTAEDLAELIGREAAKRLAPFGVTVTGLTVWETPTCSATWRP